MSAAENSAKLAAKHDDLQACILQVRQERPDITEDMARDMCMAELGIAKPGAPGAAPAAAPPAATPPAAEPAAEPATGKPKSITITFTKDGAKQTKEFSAEEVEKAGGVEALTKALETAPAPAKHAVPLQHLKHSFGWVMPIPIDAGFDPKDYMLIKGVAMSEGEAKRGERMSKDNITFAAGAMSTSGMLGMAQIDVDHFEFELPKEYDSEYPGLGNPYPPAFIMDAAVDVNDVKGEKLNQVEFVGFAVNPKFYEMVEKGMFVGTSVVDYFRKKNCDCGTEQSEHACNKCDIQGSHFLTMTAVLKQVPNSNGTWIAPVTKEDMGTIFTYDASKANALGEMLKKNMMAQLRVHMLKAAHSIKAGNMDAKQFVEAVHKLAATEGARVFIKQVDANTEALYLKVKVNGVEKEIALVDAVKEVSATAAAAPQVPPVAAAPHAEEPKKPEEVPAAAPKPAEEPKPAGGLTITINGSIVSEQQLMRAMDEISKRYVRPAKHSLESLWDEGRQWFSTNDPKAIEDYLMESKSLPAQLAHDIAKYLVEHPKVLSKYQVENLSGADLAMWFQHSVKMFAKLFSLDRHVSVLERIAPNRAALNVIERFTNAKLFTKPEVNYTQSKGDRACVGCRFFTPSATREDGDEEGYCVIVNGDIMGHGVCSKYESLAAAIAKKYAEPAKPAAPEAAASGAADNAVEAAAAAAGVKAPAPEKHTTEQPLKPTVPSEAAPKIKHTTGKVVEKRTLDSKKEHLKKLEKMTLPGGRHVNVHEVNRIIGEFKDYVRKDIAEDEAATEGNTQ